MAAKQAGRKATSRSAAGRTGRKAPRRAARRSEGPWVGASGFAVRMAVDVEQRSTGQRSHREEIAVYTVQGGKILREDFMFPAGGPAA